MEKNTQDFIASGKTQTLTVTADPTAQNGPAAPVTSPSAKDAYLLTIVGDRRKKDREAQGATVDPRSGGSRKVMLKRISPTSKALDGKGDMPSTELNYIQQEEETVEAPNTSDYNPINDNPFKNVLQDALSTFSIDVDTAAYSNVRQHLNSGQLPPPDAVRIEEMVNYFSYNYETPKDDKPFAVNAEVAQCPWTPENKLVRIGLKGREIAEDKRPATNLVFLIDVSGSMNEPNKLPLVQTSLKMLVNKLGENDHVALTVYAGSSGLVLPMTSCSNKTAIIAAIDRLQAGGSTNGGAGIELAYKVATDNMIQGGVNRVILCTDGDWNVGITDRGSLTRLIEDKRQSGVFLTVLGFGMGNYKDGTMEQLADKGNGSYGYIDTQKEAEKLFVKQLSGTLVTIAKDVKIQIEFNPNQVGAYRLIGYENRVLAHEDFNNDKKDAGDIGAGHTVTALYEIVPAGKKIDVPSVDPLKYQTAAGISSAADTDELMTVKLRYKHPESDKSQLLEVAVRNSDTKYVKASRDYKFAAAVASFGMILRGSPYKGNATFDSVLELAGEVKDNDRDGYGREFIELVNKAKAMTPVK